MNSPILYNDPTGHMESCEDGDVCGHDYEYEEDRGDPHEDDGDLNEDWTGIPTGLTTDELKDWLADFFNEATYATQLLAFLIDAPFAITEGIFIVGECAVAFPEGCATGGFMGQAAFNLSLANVAETILSGTSLAFTFTADLLDNGELGEATNTSFVTFLAGGVMGDPIGDFIIDGYALGYTLGDFNGIDSLMNGEPLFIE